MAGSANDLLASDAAAAILAERGIALVLDLVSGAGAFIHWAAVTFEGPDPAAAASRVRSIGPRARDLLARARAQQKPPHLLAVEEARAIAEAWRG